MPVCFLFVSLLFILIIIFPADSTLMFQVHLLKLDRPSMMIEVEKFLHFAIWPIGILSILYYLYRKINAASVKEQERRPDKRTGKKKR